jgi:superfamily I DNA/RNA helicase
MPNEQQWGNIIYDDLSDAQKSFLTSVTDNSEKSYFLQGCAGSGKTIMAAFATDIMTGKQNKTVKLLVFTKLLSKFIRDGFPDADAGRYNVQHYHEWKASGGSEYDMLIVDESQDFRSHMIEGVRSRSNYQIWMGDASQQLYQDAKDDAAFESVHNQIDSQSRILFDINYRNSISIAQLAKAFITVNDLDRASNVSRIQKIDNFIRPIAANPRQTSGARNQPNLFIQARNEREEFDAIAQIIKDIQNSGATDKQIAVAQLHNKQVDSLERELTSRNVDVERLPAMRDRKVESLPDFKNKNLTLLSTIHSLKGLEFDYIIFPRSETSKIDFFADDDINMNLFFVLFSRAKTRIICSYTNKEESFVYNAIRGDVNNAFFQFVEASDYINEDFEEEIEQPIPDDEEIVEEQNQTAEKLVEDYFNDM